MGPIEEELNRLLSQYQGEDLADGFAGLIEDHIEFGGSVEDYFLSIDRIPSPLRELYAALIFNSTVRLDGLAFAIPRYDCLKFWSYLRSGCELLQELKLLAVIERTRSHLKEGDSQALTSNTPNVTLNQETGGITREYFSLNKNLMQKIGDYLQHHRESVLSSVRNWNGG